MRIGVDFDGVLYDIHTPWIAAYNAAYDDDLTLDRVTIWDFHRLTKPACGDKLYALRTPDLYEGLEPIVGAVLGVPLLLLGAAMITRALR